MKRSPRRLRRALLLLLTLLVGGAIARAVWVNGVFSSADTGFSGTCRVAAELAGVMDIEIAGGTAFIAVSSARGISAEDGIYALKLGGGGKPVKLAGASDDFHPRGIGLFRSPDGTGLFLMAVNRRAGASARAGATNNSLRFSIETFEIANAQTSPVLVSQGSVSGGLLTDPQDVAAAGPGSFYVTNGGVDKNALLRGVTQRLVSYGILPGSNVLYFNGMSFRVAADGFYGARGLLLTPDGSHLLLASLTSRSIQSLSREAFSGNLEEAGSLTLSVAPEKITLDSRGEFWVAGHANLLGWRSFAANAQDRTPSQVFRVSLASGVPQSAGQVYGNDGAQIAAASVAASAGNRLLVGSSLDHALLECTVR